jgi:uncharacterized protein YkwD
MFIIMNRLLKILLSLLILLSVAFCMQAQPALTKEKDLPEILIQIEQDSLRKIERLAAFEFHQLLNAYRLENELNALDWNDVLWLCCRNHSLYMGYHNNLSHSEKTGEALFTGESPGDRLSWVQNDRTIYWSGENALYNYCFRGKTVEEIAKYIAQKAIDQWKKSPPHNRNMLNGGHKLHGVAFYYDGEKIWATSLFGYPSNGLWAGNSYPKEEKKATKSNKPKKEEKKISIGQSRKILENTMCQAISNSLGIDIKPDRVLKQCARKQVIYMAANDVETSVQNRSMKAFYGKDIAQRIARTEGKLFWFLKKQTSVKEYNLEIETSEQFFSTESIERKIIRELIEKNNLENLDAESFGFYLKIKRKKSKIKVFATLLVKPKS